MGELSGGKDRESRKSGDRKKRETDRQTDRQRFLASEVLPHTNRANTFNVPEFPAGRDPSKGKTKILVTKSSPAECCQSSF